MTFIAMIAFGACFVVFTIVFILNRRSRTTKAQREEAAALGAVAMETHVKYRVTSYGGSNFDRALAERDAETIKRAVSACDYKFDLHNKLMLLRNLSAHTTKHTVWLITQTFHHANDGTSDNHSLLTNEHFFIFRELSELKLGTSGEANTEEWEKVIRYALQNIDDGRLILSLARDRGIRTLAEVTEIMSTVKQETHATLAEGTL